MSRFWHGFIHVGALALQVANAASPFVPPPYNVVVAAGLGFVQAIVALKNHSAPATK